MDMSLSEQNLVALRARERRSKRAFWAMVLAVVSGWLALWASARLGWHATVMVMAMIGIVVGVRNVR